MSESPLWVDRPTFLEPGQTKKPVKRPKKPSAEELAHRSNVVKFKTGDLLTDAGVGERFYNTRDAAAFFDMTNQWMYDVLRREVYRHPGILHEDGHVQGRYPNGAEVRYEDCTPIIPVKEGNKRRFSLSVIRDLAAARYRRGNINEEQLEAIIARIVAAESGEDWKKIPLPEPPE